MNKDILNEINNLTKDDLEIIIKQKSHLFSEEEMEVVTKRYNELNKNSLDNSITSIKNTNEFSRQLRQYDIGNGELDDLTNARILFRIFKCVNFMKNVLIVGLVCGVIGVVLAVMK